MGTKVKKAEKELVLTEDDFLFIERMLLDMGYREFTTGDSKKEFLRLNLSPPRPIVGREVSFSYKAREKGNNYTVILHTTYLKASKKWRDKETDAGWNLITEGDKAKYFAKPFSRTKGFILKFLRYAWVSRWKVEHRPLCPECQALMHIAKKDDKRQYYWICRNNIRHTEDKPVFLPWDFGLPLKATAFVKVRRAYTARYKKKVKKSGLKVTPAQKIRKPWKVGNPENLV